MKTIALIAQKGGVGKSTACVHVATRFAADGRSVAIIDCDPQATVASWGDRRAADYPEVTTGQAPRLPTLIEAARANGADLLLIDTPPAADQTALTAARAADLILIPCRPGAFDLEAITTTLSLAEIARKPAYVVLNAVPPRSNIGREATAGLVGQGAKVAPVMLSQRAAFAHAVIDGRVADEFEPGGKAAQEVDDLYTWICGQLDMPARGRVGMAA